MPRKGLVSTDEILDALSKVNIFQNPEGTLKPRSDKIWTDICALLNNKMKRDTLFLHIQKNRNSILTKIKMQMNIYEKEEINYYTSDDNSVDSLNSSASSNANKSCNKKYNCPDLLFDLDIDDVSWNNIGPVSIIYKEKSQYGNKRRYTVLQNGWTDVIQKACWDKNKLPCAYSFKRAKVLDCGDGIYLQIIGKCNECGARFKGHCLKKPIPGHGIKIAVKTLDTRGVPHVKKRMLKGSERQAVEQELLVTKAANWRRKAAKIMSYGDTEPAHLYNSNVLRKARQQAKDKDLGLYNVSEPLTSLHKMKYNVEFAGVIREIALDKFYCMYWSPMQLDLYKDIIKSKVPLSIDATGSLVRTLKRPSTLSGAIFLYQAVVPTANGIYPVFQTVSEKHDANAIAYFIKEWLRSGAPVPHEAVADFSFAMLNGISLAFNEYNIKTYINNCQHLLSGNNHVTIKCYIRVDIAHTIKMVTRWICFNNKHPRVKDFYVRCVGLMTTCKNTSDFERLFSAVLIVCSSECDDSGSDCDKEETFLLNSIRTFSIELEENSVEDVNILKETVEVHDETLIDCPQFHNIIENAKLIAEKTRLLMRPNPYYIPEFITSFTRLCRYYVLWTNVMSEYSETNYAVASSARSESYFNELKNIILSDDSRPLRIDKFIVKHIRSIIATSKIQRAAFNNELNTRTHVTSQSQIEPESDQCSIHSISTETDIKQDPDLSETQLQEEENWRGKNKKKDPINNDDINAPSQRGKYLKSCPNISLLHHRPLRKRKDAIIQNGNLLPPIKIGKIKIQMMNTCSFDAIAELLTNGYSNYIAYQRRVEADFSDVIFFRLISDYSKNKLTKNWYTERAIRLSRVLDKPLSNTIDCTSNIANLIDKLLDGVPSVVNEINCQKCKTTYKTVKPTLQIDAQPILNKGIESGLQTTINTYFVKQKRARCINCKNYACEKSEPGPHILLDTEYPFINMPKNEKELTVTLSEIPQTLIINNNTYNLIGIVHFVSPKIDEGIGHYIAFCKNITGIWKQHDDLKIKPEIIAPSISNTYVKPAIIGYVKN